jgi:Domain of unknown function (DUF1707)
MAGPGNEKMAALGGCGHLRASHADRERVIDMLKAAFEQGRLTSGCLPGPTCSGNGTARLCRRQEYASGARTPPHLTPRERPAQPGRVR